MQAFTSSGLSTFTLCAAPLMIFNGYPVCRAHALLYSHSSSSSTINGELVSESNDTNYAFSVFSKDAGSWKELSDDEKSTRYDELKAILQK